MERNDSTPRAGNKKATWHKPKLEELGNLRQFVQAGNAFGKSIGPGDGSSNPGGETMEM